MVADRGSVLRITNGWQVPAESNPGIGVHFSEPDRGTIIRILFPLENGKIREKVTESLSGAPIPTPDKGLILVVDEVETVLSTVKSMLERSGYTVLTATDGLEAIQKVRNHAKNLVCLLLDFSMTQMNGIEAFSQIRQIRSDLPVILCSGYKQREVISYFKEKNQISFLQKPFRYRDLVEKMEEVLNSR